MSICSCNGMWWWVWTTVTGCASFKRGAWKVPIGASINEWCTVSSCKVVLPADFRCLLSLATCCESMALCAISNAQFLTYAVEPWSTTCTLLDETYITTSCVATKSNKSGYENLAFYLGHHKLPRVWTFQIVVFARMFEWSPCPMKELATMKRMT